MRPPDSRNLLTEDGHVPPDELGVEGGVGGGLAAVEAGGEEVDVEEGHPQANNRRAGPVQGDVLEVVDCDKFSLARIALQQVA